MKKVLKIKDWLLEGKMQFEWCIGGYSVVRFKDGVYFRNMSVVATPAGIGYIQNFYDDEIHVNVNINGSSIALEINDINKSLLAK